MAAMAQDKAADDAAAPRFGAAAAAATCALVVLVVGGAANAGFALWTEVVAARAEALASDAVLPGRSASIDLEPLTEVEAACLVSCPPRVLDAAATVRLAAAAALPVDQRGPLLARAGRDLGAASAAEPLNGPVAIRQAYAASLAPRAGRADVLGLIERSYAVQPYSKSGGLWRVEGVARNWDIASPNLKSEALREALWLPETGVSDRKSITDLFESAGLGLQLHLARSLPPV